MKTSKIFLLLVMISSYCLVTSCSSEDETNKNGIKDAEVSTFLKSFYKKNSELGKPVVIKSKNQTGVLNRTVELESYLITEVFVGDDTRARGYILTEKSSNDFVFFLDVNRIDYKVTTIKIETNDTKYFNEINELEKYLATDEFDFIKVIEDPTFEEPIVTDPEPVTFRIRYSYGSCKDGVRGVYQATYFLGIRFTKVTATMVDNGGTYLEQATVGCNEEYNP